MEATTRTVPRSAVAAGARVHHRLHCGDSQGASCGGDGEPTPLDLAAARQVLEAGAAGICAAERDRLRHLLGEEFKTVMAYPASGHLADAVLWASLLGVLSMPPPAGA